MNLSGNKLGDENINYFDKLNCKNLKKIYLYANRFTDYTIFKILNKNFKNLEFLYIGFNRFHKNIENLKELHFKKLIQLGLNYAFNQDNYNNLGKFKLINLEKLFIQSNGISNLDILQHMNLFKIKEIYLINNELNEIDLNSFIEFDNLERVYLDNSTPKTKNFKKIKDLKKFKYFDCNSIALNLEAINKKETKLIKDLEIKLNE